MTGRTTAGRRASIPHPVSAATQGGYATQPWRAVDGGVLLSVRLTPKGGRDAIDGVDTLADGHTVLKARVRAAPVDGAANVALIALIARTAGVPRGAVGFVAGETARIKRLRIAGDPARVIAALQHGAGRRASA
jgi:uncharacterized protein YggU (UPF0235/DUF167 family)